MEVVLFIIILFTVFGWSVFGMYVLPFATAAMAYIISITLNESLCERFSRTHRSVRIIESIVGSAIHSLATASSICRDNPAFFADFETSHLQKAFANGRPVYSKRERRSNIDSISKLSSHFCLAKYTDNNHNVVIRCWPSIGIMSF